MKNSTDDFEYLQIIAIEDNSLLIFSWQGWSVGVFKCFLGICGLTCIIGRSLIINFILKYAPKQRPINTMILVDQVGIPILNSKVKYV